MTLIVTHRKARRLLLEATCCQWWWYWCSAVYLCKLRLKEHLLQDILTYAHGHASHITWYKNIERQVFILWDIYVDFIVLESFHETFKVKMILIVWWHSVVFKSIPSTQVGLKVQKIACDKSLPIQQENETKIENEFNPNIFFYPIKELLQKYKLEELII